VHFYCADIDLIATQFCTLQRQIIIPYIRELRLTTKYNGQIQCTVNGKSIKNIFSNFFQEIYPYITQTPFS
jgi:hypothetical protein